MIRRHPMIWSPCGAVPASVGRPCAQASVGHRLARLAGALLLLVPALAFAQHETVGDVVDGARIYGEQCAVCHGPDGNQIAGIDFSRGQFRLATTDAELMRIVREGLPNQGMPATGFSEAQARQVMAYLRSMAADTAGPMAGDPARGRLVFEGKGQCLDCHRVGAAGSGVGPELTSIGQQRRALELEASLLDPQAVVQPSHRFYRVVTRDGETIVGRLLNHDTFTVQLLDTDERLRSFEKSALREHGVVPSPMPSFRDRLTRQELADLLSYLSTLQGRSAP
jgi:putative heme-binding domain-containing protein